MWKFIAIISFLITMFAGPVPVFADETTATINIHTNEAMTITISSDTGSPLPEISRKTIDGKGSFEIGYTEPDNYTYQIRQVFGENSDTTYDKTVYNVYVNVLYEKNQLTCVVTANPEGEKEKPNTISFVNKQQAAPTHEEIKEGTPALSTTNTPEAVNHGRQEGLSTPKTGDTSTQEVYIFIGVPALAVLLTTVTLCKKR